MTWEDYFVLAEEYYRKNGNLAIPQKYITESGVKLGVWIHTQRRAYNGTSQSKINESQILKLNSIGMIWKSKNRITWEESYSYAKKYYVEKGDLLVPFSYITDDGYGLGYWIHEQKDHYNNHSLNEEKIRLLEQIGMIWGDLFIQFWKQGYEKAKKYFEANGNLLVPQNYVESDYALGVTSLVTLFLAEGSFIPFTGFFVISPFVTASSRYELRLL